MISRKQLTHYTLGFLFSLPVISMVSGTSPSGFTDYNGPADVITIPMPPVTAADSDSLHYPFHDNITDPYSNPHYDQSPMYMDDPSNIHSSVEYDPFERQYNIEQRMGDLFYRNPSYLTFDEFKRSQFEQTTRNYWKQRAGEEDVLQRKQLIPKIYVGGELFERIFGSNTIDIRPQGSAELSFGVNIQKNDNPQIPEAQRTLATFDFKEKIQMNVIGNIGDKMKLQVNYNTEAGFDFENKLKLEYTGKEDEIIRKIEAGNVTFPLNSSLITGSQSLFGIKTQLQFGHLGVTTVFSQQKGQASTINVPPGGGQINNYEIQADQYEANKHFFISQYFKDHYDQALANLPVINSPVNITKLEVWVTNKTSSTENTHDVIAFMDLGEYNFYSSSLISQGTSVYPSDSLSNSLYSKMKSTYGGIRDVSQAPGILDPLASTYNFISGQDYKALRQARKLNASEYTYNARLGYISLNQALNADEVLGVAFEYTVAGTTEGGKVYRVGELTTSGVPPDKALFIKMLKSSTFSTKLPIWQLMMKNVYSIGAFQVQREKFVLNVEYYDDGTGNKLKYIPAGPTEPNVDQVRLIRLLNMDRLNGQNDPQPDGIFDFIEGVTINSNNGRIIFPVREPFGSYLKTKFGNPQTASKYVYQELYDSTKTAAQQVTSKNKFYLRGTYQSASGSEISLNAINIPQGSVKVTAGGVPLVENQDYTVDYNIGRVKIINTSILNSNTPIQVSLESNSLFSIQSKTLLGARFDYKFSKDFLMGGTFLHLNERPITQKVNIGDEPISNTILGLDGTYRTDSRFLTKLVDGIPLISTKEKSSVTVAGEVAGLIPGHSSAIGSSGTAYIDDFEGTQSTIDLKNPGTWFLASTPNYQYSAAMFPESQPSQDTLQVGYKRAKLAWYNVDPTVFYRDNAPSDVTSADLSNHNQRDVSEKELFPNKQYANGQEPVLSLMNLAFYPGERGPYNYGVNAISNIDFPGINSGGLFNDATKSWGGIMRRIETTDFEAANVEYIQFWVMDPYNGDAPDSNFQNVGKLYFNLGNISEDVLRDGQKSFENGLPAPPNNNYTTDPTAWGVVPHENLVVNAFDNDPAARIAQDVGLDGLSDANEIIKFQSTYLAKLAAAFGTASAAYQNALADPSADDYKYFRDASGNVLSRYKNFDNTEGNSPEAGNGSYSSSATSIPDAEDINRDNNMEVAADESYLQYEVNINPSSLSIGQNYISDIITTTTNELPDGTTKPIKWYLFKIPVKEGAQIGPGQTDQKSIRFIRMFLKGFNDPIVMRFARLELLRNEWRKVNNELPPEGENFGGSIPCSTFEVGAVSLEENGKRQPINYVVPPGIEREINAASTTNQQLNEQSISLKVKDLCDGKARAVYKNTQLDIRIYKRLKMFVHAEANGDVLNDNQVSCIIRIGSDFDENYYEYEVPLKVSLPGDNSAASVWPDVNTVDFELNKLISLKLERNNIYTKSADPYSKLYIKVDPDNPNNRMKIKGSPNLNNLRTIMIGVRNIKDDELVKSAEVWVNEMRVSDFDESGGWAATARVQTKLADFGTVSLSGSHSTYGFGPLESKFNERSKEDNLQYDIATQVELGKFIPPKAGVSIPMYFGYGETILTPQYDPLNPDVPFQQSIDNTDDATQKDRIERIGKDYTRRKSINFTNVRKNKTGGGGKGGPAKSKIYDIENFNISYGYNELYHRNVDIEYDVQKDHTGSLGYNFNATPKSITPFAKAKPFQKSKYAKPVKDFNFNFIPSTLNFRWDVQRHYGETLLRDITNSETENTPTYNKNFTMTRQYGFNYDITKSIKFDFNATNQSRIDEPYGALDTPEKRDSVRKNFFNLGRNTDYHQTGNLSYNVPLNKLPITDWVSVNTKYGFDYHWMASSLAADPITNQLYFNTALGNTIENSNTKQINTSLTLTTLYNKFKWYKKLTQPPPPKTAAKPKPALPKADKDSAAAAKDSLTNKIPPKKKEWQPSQLERTLAKIVFGIKNASLNYSETRGTLLPGFNRQSEILGSNWGEGSPAPGLGFTFGSQADIRSEAARKGWLTTDTIFNGQYSNTYTQNITGRLSYEPFDGFRVDLNVSRNYSRNQTENYRANSLTGDYTPFTHVENGNFSISYFMLNTAFVDDRSDYSNEIFDRFAANRIIFSRRLAANNSNSNPSLVTPDGYKDGYDGTQQDVLLLSFLAAYSKKDANSMSTDIFPDFPIPNWNITYDGLSKLAFAKKIFESINLSHGYRSTYNLNSYTTDVRYRDGDFVRDEINNFIPHDQISQVTLSEQFTPLIGVDVRLKNKNNITARFEWKKDRTLSLSFAGIQLTEVKGNELTVGAGYRIPNFKFPFKLFGSSKSSNDLNITADVSYRRNYTIIRKLIEGTNQATAGLSILSIKAGADYTLNQNLNLRFYYDQTINTPVVSTSYPTANTQIGFAIRFTLSQ